MQTQNFTAPDGTPMVILKAEDFERLLRSSEAFGDVSDAEAALAEIRGGIGTMPGPVLDLILDEGLTAIAAWRRYRGLSQSELARTAGLSQVFVSKIERGESYGTPRTRTALAKALDAPVWALEDGTN